MRFENFKRFGLNEKESATQGGKGDQMNIKHVIKGDAEAAELAKNMVGDGGEPNMYFVTVSNDFMVKDGTDLNWYSEIYKTSPVEGEKFIETETFGPFDKSKDALKTAEEVGLSETTGPRYVMIEDRKTGVIYERFLTAEKRTVWSEDTNNNISS